MKNKGSFVSNVLMLMISHIFIKFFGLIYRLVITNIQGFGDLGNGYYSAGYQVYTVLLLLSSQGIPGAVSKLVSNEVALGNYKKAHKIFKVSLLLFAIIGGICSIILFVFSDFIAINILNVKDVTWVLKVLSPAIFFVCVSAVIRGYFAGLGTMKASSISQALEQFFNCVLTITLVYSLVGKEPYVMAAGGTLATTLAVIISFSYLLLFYKINIKKYTEINPLEKDDKTSFKSMSKVIIMTAIPLTVGSIIAVVTNLIDTVTVSHCIQVAYKGILESKLLLEQEAMRLTGILNKVDTLVNLPLAVNLSFYSALIPAITASLTQKDYKSAIKKISFSTSTTFMIVLPCAVGFIVLANPILQMLYPNASDGMHILQIASVTMVLIAINHTLQGSLFGLGRMYMPAIALLCGSVVKIILNLFLISNPNINIYGAVISSLVCHIVAFIIIYTTIRKTIDFKIDVKNGLFKPLLASIIMGTFVFISYNLFVSLLGNTLSTVISILVGVIVYFICIVLFKVFSKEQIYDFPMGDKIYKFLVKTKLYNE